MPAGRGKVATLWRAGIIKWQEIKMPSATTIFRRDGVSMAYNTLIYRGDYNRFIVYVSFFLSYGLTICGGYLLATEAYKRNVYGADPRLDPNDWLDTLQPTILGFACLGLFALKMTAITRFYILRMYYNKSKQEFTYTTVNTFKPWALSRYTCKPGNATELRQKHTDWILGNTKINGRRFMMSGKEFKYPIYYSVLFGYSKPEAIDTLDDTNLDAERLFKLRRRSFAAEIEQNDFT